MLALPPIETSQRVERLRQVLAAESLDALIVTSLTNIRWLTGFAGSNATVVVTAGDVHLCTDSRYDERAASELDAAGSAAVIHIVRDAGSTIAAIVTDAVSVGAEADHLTWAQRTTIESEWLPGLELVATVEMISRLRARKDDAEVARIRAAAAVADSALADVAPRLTSGVTEREFVQLLEHAIRTGGADDIGFDTIVASGPNGAVPHHLPGERTIQQGDLVIVDVGARVDGYRSDMTRTFCIGPMTADQRYHHQVVIAAQQAGIDAMVVGGATAAVDAAARAVITEAGWADAFGHGTGHGIGLDIHELPRVTARSEELYEVGTVATVEPGVYLPGIGGVRVEDTCVGTHGGAERLTGFVGPVEI